MYTKHSYRYRRVTMSAALSMLLFLVTFFQHGAAQYKSQWQQNGRMIIDNRMQQLPLMNIPADHTSFVQSVFSRNNNECGKQGFTDEFTKQPRNIGTTNGKDISWKDRNIGTTNGKDISWKDRNIPDISWKDYMQKAANLRFCDNYVASLGIATRIVSNSVLRFWIADELCEKMIFDYIMPMMTKGIFGFDYAKWEPEVIYEKLGKEL